MGTFGSPLLVVSILIVIVGAIGGLVNALLSNDLRLLPGNVSGSLVYRLGIVGNAIVGGVAAFITFALYGGLAPESFIGQNINQDPVSLTLSAVGGALVTGIAGTRVLTSEVDKKLLKLAGRAAASGPPNFGLATQFDTATPAEAFESAQQVLTTVE